jgi:GNAT superfamily N-acetyltransferase
LEEVSGPRLLEDTDDLSLFNCGVPALNDWLKFRAKGNHISGASRTYVAEGNRRISAFYCLSAGSINHSDSPGKFRRNMPDPVPVIIMGRLAVDIGFRGNGLGAALIKDALVRTVAIGQQAGVRALMVHAKDKDAARFYQKHDFIAAPHSELLLLIGI